MRTVFWADDKFKLIDQRRLPAALEVASFTRCDDVAGAIRQMVVRGAPAIGAAAAFGLALAAQESSAANARDLMVDLRRAAATLRATRPTAVNLGWAIDRILKAVEAFVGTMSHIRRQVVVEAQRLADEDVETNRRMAQIGASLIDDGDTIIHHCNTGLQNGQADLPKPAKLRSAGLLPFLAQPKSHRIHGMNWKSSSFRLTWG